MNLAEYTSYDGLGLAALVKARQVTAKELAQIMLQAVARVNPQLNCVIESYADRVAMLSQDFQPQGPFGGVPFLLKDIGAGEASQVQELGSRLAQGNRLTHEAFLTTAFKGTGLLILGRTTTPEFALSSSTESLLQGATHNPWQLGRITGGSSGGAAASVAAGIVPIAHASDGAGSIRIPASACGLVGLKPSRGRVSLGPALADMLMGMGVEFALCRTVRDCAAMLDAVSQPAPGDPFVIRQPARPYAQEVGAPVEALRIAWSTASNLPGMTTDPAVQQSVERVVTWLAQQGHAVTEARPRFDYEEYLDAICVGWIYGFDRWLDGLAAVNKRPVDETTVETISLAMYHEARQLTVAKVLWAEEVYNRLRRQIGHFFSKYDLLVTPTLTRPPETLGYFSLNVTDVDFQGFFRRCDESASHLPLYNLTGQPALSLPLGQSADGLPLGVQFVAHFGREDLLLRLAAQIEVALPWHDRRPAIFAGQ